LTSGLYVLQTEPQPDEGKPLVVLVHGSMDRHRSFGRVRARLHDHPVVVYDRRGYARSRAVAPPARGVLDHAADLLEVLDGREAVVLGHSYGGVVALAAAARTQLIRSLVVFEPPLGWLRWWHMAGMPHAAAPFRGMDPGDAAEAFVRRVVGSRIDRVAEADRAEWRADGPALVTELTAIRRDPAPFDPVAIAAPTVVARGSRSADRHRQGAAWLMSHLPNAELHIVEGSDHGAHISHPAEVAQLVRRAAELGFPTSEP
jgi:pimeloyl-ACP methyl ester carboxylesterase